jgi:uncharacterized protein
MRCPIDETTLVMSERNGIEIDYCPQCRGVWLDRGELDKIIDRADSGSGQPPLTQAQQYPTPQPGYAPQTYDRRPAQQQGYGQPAKKKRENWLSELFD